MLHTVFRVAALTCLVIGQVFGSGEDLNSLNPDNVPSAFPRYKDFAGNPYSVTYNERAILLNDSPVLFISGSIHPPRITPKSLPRVLDLAKKHGMNMLEIYTFWNYHQPTEDTWNWEGQANLTEFIQTLGDHGFFVTLRIGPYVCAEWTYGGVPVWVGQKEGVKFRCSNDIWQQEMEKFFNRIVEAVEPLYAKHGGPIILTQVENELHTNDKTYVQWCGDMAEAALKAVDNPPVIMCNGEVATNTINTCNGPSCTEFIESNGQNGRVLVDQPPLWTEMEQGFQVWGASPSDPTNYFWGTAASEIGFRVAQWFARGGSHVNYYMLAGGNNFGLWPGNGITTMYASDAAICPDFFPHRPKYEHLTRLHNILAAFSEAMLSGPAQVHRQVYLRHLNPKTGKFENGTQQYAFTYGDAWQTVTFLENIGTNKEVVEWESGVFPLPPRSISIVDASLNVVWSSTGLYAPAVHIQDTPIQTSPFEWEYWEEPLSSKDTSKFPSSIHASPPEQGTISHGLSEYLWYSTNLTSSGQSAATLIIPTVTSNLMSVFLNGEFIGSGGDHSHSTQHAVNVSITIPAIPAGRSELLILSETLGYDNLMAACSSPKVKGIIGNVLLNGAALEGPWKARNELAGNVLQVWAPSNQGSIPWQSSGTSNRPTTWYKTTFTLDMSAVTSDTAVLLKPTGFTRGHLFVNGHDAGRYWTILRNDGSNVPTQSFYYIPTDWLSADGNNVLVLSDTGGATDPSQAMVYTREEVPGAPPPPASGWGDGINSCPL